jgi:hypothetical protein
MNKGNAKAKNRAKFELHFVILGLLLKRLTKLKKGLSYCLVYIPAINRDVMAVTKPKIYSNAKYITIIIPIEHNRVHN